MTVATRVGAGLLVTAIVAVWLAYALAMPLQAVHWDTPIYVYKGKLAAESGLIADLAADSARIGSEFRWEPFWHFYRIGNVAVLGAVVGAMGATVEAIRAMHVLYVAMMAATLVLAYFVVRQLFGLLRCQADSLALSNGILVSLLLFSLSDVAFYLARSLVSEVPSLLAVTAAALLLLLSQARRSPGLAVLCGIFAFLAHFIRYEAIWVIAVFAVFLLIQQLSRAREELWVPGYVVMVVTALGTFLIHSAIFFPMTDPRFFLEYIGAADKARGEPNLVHSLGAAGGLLWVGALVGLALGRRGQLLRQGGGLFAISMLPFLPYLALGAVFQTRMLAPLLFLPLLLASSIGWTSLLELGARWRLVRGGVGLSVLLLLLVHLSWTYSALVELPGLWRLQALKRVDRASFTINAWEKYDFDVPQLAQIAARLKADPAVTLIPGAHYGVLYLVRYFADEYADGQNFAIVSNPARGQMSHCPRGSDRPQEPGLLTCVVEEPGNLDSVRSAGRPVLQVFDKQNDGWAKASGVCLDRANPPLIENRRYAVFRCD